MKIAAKIRLSFLLPFIILTILCSSAVYLIAGNYLRGAIYEHLATVSASRAKHIETFFELNKEIVLGFAEIPPISNFLSADKKGADYGDKFIMVLDSLKLMDKELKDIYEIFVLDRNGRVVLSSDESKIGLDRSSDAYFLGGLNGPYIKDTYYSQITKRNSVDIAAPVLDNRRAGILGVLVCRVDLSGLNKITLDRTGLGRTGECYVVNQYGYTVTPSAFLKEDVFLKQKVYTENVIKGRLHKAREHVLDIKEQISIYRDYHGVLVLGTHEHIPELKWLVVTEIDAKEVFEPLAILKFIFVLILIIVPVIAWLLGSFISRAIIEPLRKLHKGIEVIGEGNLDYKVGTRVNDEVGQLSRAFDKMTNDLKTKTTSIDNLNKEISERKKAEFLRRASEERFRQLFESSRDAIMILDRAGFIECNKKTLGLFGIKDKENFIKKHPAELSPLLQPDGRDSLSVASKHIERAFKEGEDFFEWDHKKADGTVFPAEVLLSRFRLEEKEYLQATVRDITQRKQAEEKIELAIEEWERTFNSITDLVFIQDKDFTITKVNKSCCAALKLKPEEIIGRKCYQVLHNLDHPWPGCPGAATQSDRTPHEAEIDDPHIGVPLLVTVSPIFNAKGEFAGLVHVARDISERKKVENALREIIEMKTNFTSTVSHELRTPLAAIKEGIGIVLDGTSGAISEDQKEFLDIAKRNVDRLTRIINDILDFQKLESGKMAFNMQANDINEVVSEAGKTMRAVIEQKGLVLALELDEKLPKIQFDRDKIIQVLTNLINNAVKFTEKGNIKIRTAREENIIKVSVKDTGVGIKETDIPLLFERFKQLDSGMTRKTGGTGLGLSICKDIVDKHNGKVWVESKAGEGSTFSFGLPVI